MHNLANEVVKLREILNSCYINKDGNEYKLLSAIIEVIDKIDDEITDIRYRTVERNDINE